MLIHNIDDCLKMALYYDAYAKGYAELTVEAEDALPTGLEQKRLNVVLGIILAV